MPVRNRSHPFGLLLIVLQNCCKIIYLKVFDFSFQFLQSKMNWFFSPTMN